MEKVSAMKKVALFLMIVGLAVAMVACQGAVGPKAGDQGDQGDQGDGRATRGARSSRRAGIHAACRLMGDAPFVLINDARR